MQFLKIPIIISFVLICVLNACTFTSDFDVNTKPPTVYSSEATDITSTSMVLWGELTDDGNDEIDELGFYYNTTGNPSLDDGIKVTCSYDSTIFFFELTNLEIGTTYYFSAFAKNDAGTTTALSKECKTKAYVFGSFTDTRDNKIYKTVQIGAQEWMAENMAFLPEVQPSTENSLSKALHYVYGYEGTNVEEAKATDNFKKLGVLYNWGAALLAAPVGWRIPTKEDWEQLAQFISDENSECSKNEDNWYGVGDFLKDEKSWGEYQNKYGFTLLPANFMDGSYGYSSSEGNFTYLWSSNEELYNKITAGLIQRHQNSLWLKPTNKATGCSIRLIKE